MDHFQLKEAAAALADKMINLMYNQDSADEGMALARSLLLEQPESLRREVMMELATWPRNHVLDLGRERVFWLTEQAEVPKPAVIQAMATQALIWIQEYPVRKTGRRIMTWLMEHQQLATRSDMGPNGQDNILGVLRMAWHTRNLSWYDPGIRDFPDPVEYTRTWVSTLAGQVVAYGGGMGDVLLRVAQDHEQEDNPGLMLGLMDAGAPCENLLGDPDIEDHTWQIIATHAHWKRMLLMGQATKHHDETDAPVKRPERGL